MVPSFLVATLFLLLLLFSWGREASRQWRLLTPSCLVLMGRVVEVRLQEDAGYIRKRSLYLQRSEHPDALGI